MYIVVMKKGGVIVVNMYRDIVYLYWNVKQCKGE